MAKIRDLLVHVSIETAVRKRKCHRSSAHHVEAGQRFLSVRESQNLGYKNYCNQCARDILTIATTKLAELTRTIGV